MAIIGLDCGLLLLTIVLCVTVSALLGGCRRPVSQQQPHAVKVEQPSQPQQPLQASQALQLAAGGLPAQEQQPEPQAAAAAHDKPVTGAAAAIDIAVSSSSRVWADTSGSRQAGMEEGQPHPSPGQQLRSCGSRLALGRPDTVAVVVVGATKTVALGVPIITVIYGDSQYMGLLTVPLIAYHAIQIVALGAVLRRMKRWTLGQQVWGRERPSAVIAS
jgi:hypothetical protein